MVSSGAPRRLSSSRASAADAARAPMRCSAARTREPVAQDGQRYTACAAQTLDVDDVRPGGNAEPPGDGVGGRHRLQRQHLRAGLLVRCPQVLEEAGQLHRALHLPAHHRRADAPPAHEQALVDEIGDRLAHGRSGEAPPLGERDLVVQSVAHLQVSARDHRFQVLGHLEVEGQRARPIEHRVGKGHARNVAAVVTSR
jgi:hypothetical protein